MFGYAVSRTRQPALFDTGGPPAVTAMCDQCGEFLERTPSNYLACPRGHGKLLNEASDDESDAEAVPPWTWPDYACRVAKRHAARDNWLGTRWRCCCGACEQ